MVGKLASGGQVPRLWVGGDGRAAVEEWARKTDSRQRDWSRKAEAGDHVTIKRC